MRWSGAIVAVSLLFLCACGGGSESSIPNITVYVTPLSADVSLGGTQQFTATTSGYNDTTVVWYVNGVKGGNSTYGTVSQAGLYTAPTTAPDPTSVSVTAISAKNTSSIASAAVSIVSGLTITVAPAAVDLQLGGTQQFAATVVGVSNTAVSWKVAGIAGGNSTVGTVTSSGLYTAPVKASTPISVAVTATAAADATKSAAASVTLHGGISVAVTPSPATVHTFGSQQFTPAVSGADNTAVSWKVNGIAGGNAEVGTISASGIYSAPRSVPTDTSSGSSKTKAVTVTAVSRADSYVSASVQVTLVAANADAQAIPIPLGVSGGNAGDHSTLCCGGTLGALVSRGGKQYILSASHVLAPGGAQSGDSIIQPGLLDANCSTTGTSPVATLSQYVSMATTTSTNVVDAALAEVLTNKVDALGNIVSLGDSLVNGVPGNGMVHAGSGIAPTMGLGVAKSGRSTGLTCSTISAIGVTARIGFETSCGSGQLNYVTLNNLIDVHDASFSADGDSGALLVSQSTADPVALLVANTGDDSLAVPVSVVLSALADTNTGEKPVFAGAAEEHVVAGCNWAPTASVSALTAKATTATLGLSAAELERARTVYANHIDELMAVSGVLGVGITAAGDGSGEAALLVLLARGVSQDTIPENIDDLAVKIREINAIRANRAAGKTNSCPAHKSSAYSGK